MFRNLASGLRALFGKKRSESEMDEELRAYLDTAVENNVRSGMKPDDALRAARVQMGSVEAVKDEVRSAGWETHIESLWRDIRYGMRMLRKNTAFTAVVIFTLALGIGANTAIFSIIDAVLMRSLPVENPSELVRILRKTPLAPDPGSYFTNALWEQVRDRQDVFSGAFAWSNEMFDLAQGGPVDLVNGLWVSGDYFRVLGVHQTVGRLITTSDDYRGCPGTVVLSHDFWQEHYGGDPRAVGSTLSLNNHRFTIVGVSSRGFYGMNVGSKFDVALPICATALLDPPKQQRIDHRSWWWLQIVARAKPGVGLTQIGSRLAVLSPDVFKGAMPANWPASVQNNFARNTLRVAPAPTGVSEVRHDYERPLHVLMVVVGVVLLIACANIASLMLARSAARRREIAVRQALGASRRRLIRQLLIECILLSSLGAIGGIILARWAGVLLLGSISTSENQVFLELTLDAPVLWFTAGIAVATGILFGVLPALRSTRVSTASAMKGGAAPDSEHRVRFRAGKIIVAAQVAMSLVLLVAAGLFLRSFQKLVTLDLGFDRDNVLLVNANLKPTHIPADQRDSTYADILGRLRAIPGVVSVSRSANTPLSGAEWNDTIVPDAPNPPKGDDATAYFNFVSPGYFETLRIPRLAGRNFNGGDTANSARVAIVNQSLAGRFFRGLDPVGRTFEVDPQPGKKLQPVQVIGVVRNSKYESIREDAFPTAFFPVSQMSGMMDHQNYALRIAVAPSGITGGVEKAVAQVNKEISLRFRMLSQQVADSIVRDRMLAMLSTFFGGLALLLAMVGLYGTFSYMVTQRQKEFGVRMALGARLRAIVNLVLRDVALVLAAGIAVGVGIALLTVGPLQKMLFDLGARDTLTVAAAVAVLAAVAFVAAWLPARRAARVDPMVTLRHE